MKNSNRALQTSFIKQLNELGKIPVIFALKHIFCISPFEYFLCRLPSFGYLECVLMGAEVEPAILLACPVQAGQAAVQVVDHTLQAGQAAVQVVDHTLCIAARSGDLGLLLPRKLNIL